MRAMKPRRVLVLDLVTHAPAKALFHRVMMANMAGFMPQVAAVWTEELGHETIYVPFVGQRDFRGERRTRRSRSGTARRFRPAPDRS